MSKVGMFLPENKQYYIKVICMELFTCTDRPYFPQFFGQNMLYGFTLKMYDFPQICKNKISSRNLSIGMIKKLVNSIKLVPR